MVHGPRTTIVPALHSFFESLIFRPSKRTSEELPRSSEVHFEGRKVREGPGSSSEEGPGSSSEARFEGRIVQYKLVLAYDVTAPVASSKRQKRSGDSVDFMSLAAAWDRRALRYGDMINVPELAFHPNTVTSLISMQWRFCRPSKQTSEELLRRRPRKLFRSSSGEGPGSPLSRPCHISVCKWAGSQQWAWHSGKLEQQTLVRFGIRPTI